MAEARLSDDHFILFGRIMYGYASAEFQLKILLSAMLRIDISAFLVVSEPYTSHHLRNVLKSIAKWSTFENEEEFDKIIEMTGRFKSFGSLRNSIAHSRWAEGDRPNSIRPYAMNIREGKAIPLGYEEGEKDYTISELAELAKKTFILSNDIKKFIIDYGYAGILEEISTDNCTNI